MKRFCYFLTGTKTVTEKVNYSNKDLFRQMINFIITINFLKSRVPSTKAIDDTEREKKQERERKEEKE